MSIAFRVSGFWCAGLCSGGDGDVELRESTVGQKLGRRHKNAVHDMVMVCRQSRPIAGQQRNKWGCRVIKLYV
ncbi:hypothetical protein C7974DRAFT_397180 [Boeremia exigua]|uniref:uncharacterized protein n=1 Tax=Boeremia exigua TaxID=749465 RepID=UPI001E8E4662|nr:uncharacterized protein C7974DRAFT_397180 [Boeremia exigua]KAH6621809.1 hypothetical protein C7974DRAFT_397180 [Boeremia exigua]